MTKIFEKNTKVDDPHFEIANNDSEKDKDKFILLSVLWTISNGGNGGNDGIGGLIIWAAIVLTGALLGGIYYYFSKKTPKEGDVAEAESTPKPTPESVSEKSNDVTSNSIPSPDLDTVLNMDPTSLYDQLISFFNLWPWHQWVGSLISLVVLYLITGYYYNKFLEKRVGGKWLTFKYRLWLIAFDLLVNLALGLYYMQHREAFLGPIMMRCPIAISPVIFLLELIVVSCYYYFLSTSRGTDFVEKRKKIFVKCYIYVKRATNYIKAKAKVK